MNNQNTAKKIIEVDLSNKWPVGSVIVAKSMANRYRSSALILSYLGNDTVSVSHASGRPTTMQTKTMQAKYRLATESEAIVFRGAIIGPDRDSAMDESKDAVPRGPRKVEAAPVVEPEPQPTPTPSAPVSLVAPVATAAPVTAESVAAVVTATLDASLPRMFQMATEAAVTAALAAVRASTPAPVAVAAAPEAEDSEEKRALRELAKIKRPGVEPLLTEFLHTKTEELDLRNPAHVKRALTTEDVREGFAMWCEARGAESPHPYVTNVILKDLASVRKVGKGDKQTLALGWARQVPLDLDAVAATPAPTGDALDAAVKVVVNYAHKRLWPGARVPSVTSGMVLARLREGVSTDDLRAAVDGAVRYLGNSTTATDLATFTFRTKKRVSYLASLASGKGQAA